MLHYVNYRMRITLQDSRVLVGIFMAFDKYMNIVIGDTEEYRTIKSKKGTGISEEKQEKRSLGLIILRGDTVVSMTIEGPPPPESDEKLTPGGPGIAKAAGRGLPIAPLGGAQIGLAGPVRGVGGPMSSIMQPPSQVAASASAQMMGMPRPPMPIPGGMSMPMMPRGPPGFPGAGGFPGAFPPPMPGMGMGMGMMPPGMPPGMMPPRGMPPGMPMFPGPPPPRG